MGKHMFWRAALQAWISTTAGFGGKRLIQVNPSKSFTRSVETKPAVLEWVSRLLPCFPTLYGYGFGFWF